MNTRRILQLKAMPYEDYLKTPEWREKRDQVLERDRHRCRVCNSEETLHVHHRTYARRGHEDLNDLTTLCKDCHEYFHKMPRSTDCMGSSEPEEVIDEASRKIAGIKKWESYLLGILIIRPNFYPYIAGFLSEDIFLDDEARALYQIISSASRENQSIETLIPPELDSAVSRYIAPLSAIAEEIQPNEAVKVAVRIKSAHLTRTAKELSFAIRDAQIAGDDDKYRQLTQRLLTIHRQLGTIAVSKQLRG